MAKKQTPAKDSPSADAEGFSASDKPEKRGVGRPTTYKPEYAKQVATLCQLGATDAQLADFFGCSVSTLNLWKVRHPEFSSSIRLAKDKADELVEQSLFKRAMGYEHDEVDIRVIDGQVVQTPLRKAYPPDTTAMIFWLKNRRPAEWRDKIDQELTGPNGGPVQHRVAVEFVKAK